MKIYQPSGSRMRAISSTGWNRTLPQVIGGNQSRDLGLCSFFFSEDKMANNTNKITIVARINAEAKKYKSNLVGNTFLIIYEGNCIELSFRATQPRFAT